MGFCCSMTDHLVTNDSVDGLKLTTCCIQDNLNWKFLRWPDMWHTSDVKCALLSYCISQPWDHNDQGISQETSTSTSAAYFWRSVKPVKLTYSQDIQLAHTTHTHIHYTHSNILTCINETIIKSLNFSGLPYYSVDYLNFMFIILITWFGGLACHIINVKSIYNLNRSSIKSCPTFNHCSQSLSMFLHNSWDKIEAVKEAKPIDARIVMMAWIHRNDSVWPFECNW